MNTMRFHHLLFLLSCFLIIGCYSPSKFYSAKTVGEKEFDLGLSVDIVTNTFDYATETHNKNTTLTYGSLGLLGRYGINNNSDVGFYLNTTGFVGVDYRYQILGDRTVDKFFISTGPAYSVNIITLDYGGFHELSLPIYMSYYFNDFISFTITPRASVHGIGIFGLASEFSFYSNVGVTSGLEIGSGPLRIFLGFNYQRYLNAIIENEDYIPRNYSVGAAIRYRFGEER